MFPPYLIEEAVPILYNTINWSKLNYYFQVLRYSLGVSKYSINYNMRLIEAGTINTIAYESMSFEIKYV